MDNFDVHEWNKNRYLNRINESDDPKIGSELEGDPDERVEEGTGSRQATMKLDQLTFNVVKGMFGKIPMFGLGFPNADDSYRSVFDADDLEDWKARIRDRFGNVNIRIDTEADSKWEQVKILDDKFINDKKSYIDRKGATLDKWRKDSNYGFDENLNEASYMYKGYEDKHFDICPVAETLRDELLAGKFKDNTWATGTDFEKEVGEWRYQHDVLFKTEKQVLQDKEGDESDIEKAKVAIDRIVNLSRDLGIPADRLDYLKAHLKKITDIVEYSSLTESTLCKRGQDYIKARKAAGEKSSAYLSGRAVKVCKGDIKFKGKKQKDFKNESLDEYVDNGPEEKSFDVEMEKAGKGIASAIEKELKNKKPQELNEAIITSVIAGVLTGNSLINFISKLAKLLFKKIGFKKGEDIAGKIQHWAHDNEIAFQKPIKRILSFFIKDTKTLDIVTKGIYAIVVGSMAANYGAEALSSLSKSDWFASSLNALKTLAKSDETIVNAYPAIRALI
jgi:hypothetical protein